MDISQSRALKSKGLKIGAHVSISQGYVGALKKVVRIGGNCLQIFSTSPRSWQKAKVSQGARQEFLSLKKKLAVEPVYFHASYLINLGDAGRVGQLSKTALAYELSLAPELGIQGSIIHLGSFKDKGKGLAYQNQNYELLLQNINFVLKNSPPEALFIIENAGMRKIGKNLEEIAQIIQDLKNERVRVCLDTCHLHAAGYDISSRKKLDKFLAEFERLIGLNKLELWHLNDSRDPFGSFRDRHENIGQGYLGLKPFQILLHHPALQKLPFIIETPGFDQKGPDAKNIKILKSLGGSVLPTRFSLH